MKKIQDRKIPEVGGAKVAMEIDRKEKGVGEKGVRVGWQWGWGGWVGEGVLKGSIRRDFPKPTLFPKENAPAGHCSAKIGRASAREIV